MPKAMTKQLGLKIELCNDTFTFVDCLRVTSRAILKDVHVEIDDAIFHVDFQIIEL